MKNYSNFEKLLIILANLILIGSVLLACYELYQIIKKSLVETHEFNKEQAKQDEEELKGQFVD